MVDSSGPGRRKKCYGLSFVDLSDIEGFDSPPINNQLYGLEFANGIYRRKEIEENNNNNNLLNSELGVEDKVYGFKFKNNVYTQQEIIKPEAKFKELIDVNFDDVEQNKKYHLVKNNLGNWFLMPTINWLIDIIIHPRNIQPNKQDKIKKIFNNGSSFLSYSSNKKQSLVIHEQNDEYYIKRDNDIASNLIIFLDAADVVNEENLKVSRNDTLIIELYLLTPPTEALTVIPGVKINWTAEAQNKKCILFVRGINQTLANLPNVTITVTPQVKINKIDITNNFYFKSLKMINQLLPVSYLRSMINI